MKTNNLKRKRITESPSPWEEAKKYILQLNKVGYIHDDIHFNDDTRKITISSSSSASSHSSSSGITKGTVLMKIPSTTLITLATAEQSSYGPSLFHLLNSFKSRSDTTTCTGADSGNGDINDDVIISEHNVELYHSKDDLLLALFLSFIHTNSKNKCITNNRSEDEANIQHNNDDWIELYLATLPSNESYNNLPRRWDETKLSTLLTGTSLLQRTKDEINGLKGDYQLLFDKVAMTIHKQNNDEEKDDHVQKLMEILHPFPSFDIFDQMLAAVESRAFHGIADDQLDALIPLVDLFNHKRGCGQQSDVSYCRLDDNKDGGDNGSERVSCIIVTAKCDLEPGSMPGITYGAKGNAILLSRYGFCLEDNVEPDGSSNDVVDFNPKPGSGRTIELRFGPKSYSYGCFVKALDLFIYSDNLSDDSHTAGAYLDDMESFLNGCDPNDDGSDGGKMNLYELSEDVGVENIKEDVSREINAIGDLIAALQFVRKQYRLQGREMLELLKNNSESSERYCAILVQSELQTLFMYELAANLIGEGLRSKHNEFALITGENEVANNDILYCEMEKQLVKNQINLVRKYAEELKEIYFKIRHSI